MTAQTSSASAAGLSGSRAASLLCSTALGLFVIGIVGFSHISAVHNATHDTRHSLAFPCH
ncbi:CbtB-domain containing protein [Rhizobiaceae bacterium BDR2-2]|uniref:CbtB-domain containing protein n=1 Tax=Ectorhizobium quercum TaxID=2965071 RepID=A0AAE3SX32_9HYPH|nr:CbtB-domain containing protein [Ectorhizobium quercum]MCX8998050.1 CbtB-domain containing protein [Ectorhizobium quercum]